jgi:hypothetical protein
MISGLLPEMLFLGSWQTFAAESKPSSAAPLLERPRNRHQPHFSAVGL